MVAGCCFKASAGLREERKGEGLLQDPRRDGTRAVLVCALDGKEFVERMYKGIRAFFDLVNKQCMWKTEDGRRIERDPRKKVRGSDLWKLNPRPGPVVILADGVVSPSTNRAAPDEKLFRIMHYILATSCTPKWGKEGFSQ